MKKIISMGILSTKRHKEEIDLSWVSDMQLRDLLRVHFSGRENYRRVICENEDKILVPKLLFFQAPYFQLDMKYKGKMDDCCDLKDYSLMAVRNYFMFILSTYPSYNIQSPEDYNIQSTIELFVESVFLAQQLQDDTYSNHLISYASKTILDVSKKINILKYLLKLDSIKFEKYCLTFFNSVPAFMGVNIECGSFSKYSSPCIDPLDSNLSPLFDLWTFEDN